MSCKSKSCNCDNCTKKNQMDTEIMSTYGNVLSIQRTFKVTDDKGNPLPDVEFLKAPETERLGNNTSDFVRLGITDGNGEITITGKSDMKVVVSHVSGESYQSTLSELENSIQLQPNELDEVVITEEPTNYAGIITVGALILNGIIGKSTKKPFKIAV